jgi:hypothetical protein
MLSGASNGFYLRQVVISVKLFKESIKALKPHLYRCRVCLSWSREYTALSLVFWQLGIKIDTFHAHELETLIYYRRTQLVNSEFDAQEQRWASFW